MNKLSLIARKITALFLLFTLVLTLNITAFADFPDTSPNVPRRTEGTTQPATAIPADVKPVKNYTVELGKTYKLPADVKQTGDGYSPSNSSILKVDGKTGSFTTLKSGTAYIVVANNVTTRYIKITVGTGTATTPATQTKSALTGYTVMVKDKTTPATGCNFKMANEVEQCLFLSANGTILGSMSANDYRKIAQAGIDNGTLPTDSRELAQWFAGEFNKYRGLSVAASGGFTTNGSTTTKTTIDTKEQALEIIRLVNMEREKVGLTPLEIDSSLMQHSEIRAEELSIQYSHTRPNGVKETSECIMRGSTSASGTVKAWMDSDPHRNAMLNEDGRFNYNYIGAGCYQDANGKLHWVITFSV